MEEDKESSQKQNSFLAEPPNPWDRRGKCSKEKEFLENKQKGNAKNKKEIRVEDRIAKTNGLCVTCWVRQR